MEVDKKVSAGVTNALCVRGMKPNTPVTSFDKVIITAKLHTISAWTSR